MPNPARLRAAVLTATVLLSSLLAGCGGDDSEDEDLTAQKLDWEDCPAPSQAEGGGNPPSPLPDGMPSPLSAMRVAYTSLRGTEIVPPPPPIS